MAIDYCYISVFIIVDSYACASTLREIIPLVLLITMSLFEHVSAASQRCSVSRLLHLVYLLKHILLVTCLYVELLLEFT